MSVYRLITAKTYEQHMFHKASMKLGLDRAVLAHAKNEKEAEEVRAPLRCCRRCRRRPLKSPPRAKRTQWPHSRALAVVVDAL